MDEENITKEEASRAFASYAEVVKKSISQISSITSQHLVDVFKELEESHEFKMLGEIFSNAYGGKRSGAADSRLQNYFMRSGFYLDITKGKSINIDAFFEGLWAAFNKGNVKKTIIRPINFVHFPVEVIDLGAFKIQKLSKGELDSLLEQKVCTIFYPHAVIDTKKLSLFWLIVEESVAPKDNEKLNVFELGFTFEDSFKVKRELPARIHQLLSLFEWEDDSSRPTPDNEETDFWLILLDLPFEHTTSNNLIDCPNASPDLSGLVTRPYYTPDGEETDEEYPDFHFYLTDTQVDKLREVVGVAHGFIKDIDLKKCGWEFLEIAMGSLAKAFLSDGIEQLLWNVVALEALIGDKKETTQTILRRTSLIHGGGDVKKIEDIRKEIKKIYELRSSLVHGGTKFGDGKKAKDFFYRYHLRIARDYARKTLLWFILYLSYMHEELKKNKIPLSEYPNQELLLQLLDYQIKSFKFKYESVEVKMPDNFPGVGWVEFD